MDNKDASLFPVSIPNRCGKLQLAMIHRPLFAGTRPKEIECKNQTRLVDLDHESIWMSYSPMVLDPQGSPCLGLFNSHHRLATPIAPWESLKIGGGTPPVMTPNNSEELKGAVANVVFPTGIDCRTDIDQPDRFDIYYGMADSRVGVASLVVPLQLPTKSMASADAESGRIATDTAELA